MLWLWWLCSSGCCCVDCCCGPVGHVVVPLGHCNSGAVRILVAVGPAAKRRDTNPTETPRPRQPKPPPTWRTGGVPFLGHCNRICNGCGSFFFLWEGRKARGAGRFHEHRGQPLIRESKKDHARYPKHQADPEKKSALSHCAQSNMLPKDERRP